MGNSPSTTAPAPTPTSATVFKLDSRLRNFNSTPPSTFNTGKEAEAEPPSDSASTFPSNNHEGTPSTVNCTITGTYSLLAPQSQSQSNLDPNTRAGPSSGSRPLPILLNPLRGNVTIKQEVLDVEDSDNDDNGGDEMDMEETVTVSQEDGVEIVVDKTYKKGLLPVNVRQIKTEPDYPQISLDVVAQKEKEQNRLNNNNQTDINSNNCKQVRIGLPHINIGSSSSKNNSQGRPTHSSAEKEEIVSLSMSQFCMWCPADFKRNDDYERHIVKCNANLTKLVDFAKRKCLVCQKNHRNFNVTGLLRHSFNCIIDERYARLSKETEMNDRLKRTRGDHQPSGSMGSPPAKIPKLSSKATPEEKMSPPTRSISSPSESTPSDQRRRVMRDRMKIRPVPIDTNMENNQSISTGKAYKSRFPQKQAKILIAAYNRNAYISVDEKFALAEETGLTEIQIKNWFENKRRGPKMTTPRISPVVQQQSGVMTRRSGPVSNNKDKTEEEVRHNDKEEVKELEEVKYAEVLRKYEPLLIELFNKTNGKQTNQHQMCSDIIKVANKTGLPARVINSWLNRKKEMDTMTVKREAVSDAASSGSDSLFTKAKPARHHINRTQRKETLNKSSSQSPIANGLPKTNRQKLSSLKYISGQEIKEVLILHRQMLMQILFMYSEGDRGVKDALEEESAQLQETLAERTPFKDSQIKEFSNWHEDFVIGMYPERDGQQWIDLVNRFRSKILQVWTPILVYSRCIQMSLDEAAIDMLKLMSSNSSRQQEVNAPSLMLHLFKQVSTVDPNADEEKLQLEDDVDSNSSEL